MLPKPSVRVPALLLLKDPNFRGIWSARGLAETSRRIELLVVSWFILQTPDSLFSLALILVFLHLPRPFFSLFSGIIADRFNRRRVMLASQSLTTLTATCLMALIASDLIQPWHIFAGMFVQGSARAVEDPSRRTAVFDIVGGRWIFNAMSLEMIGMTCGSLAGPVLGGVLLDLTGFTQAYLVAVSIHLVALGLLFSVRVPLAAQGRVARSVWHSLGGGLRYVLTSRVLMGVLYLTIAMNALAFPLQQFVPAIGRNQLGLGAGLVGLLLAAEGFGRLLGAAAIASTTTLRYPGRLFLLGCVVMLVMGLAFVWSPWYALSFTLLAVSGFGLAGFGTMQSSLIMLNSSAEMRARMMGVLHICIGTGIPLGTLGLGVLVTTLGIQQAISIYMLAGVLLVAPGIMLRAMLRERPGESPLEAAPGRT